MPSAPDPRPPVPAPSGPPPGSRRGAPTSFEPPGPGSWTLDTAHFPQPATRFVVELFPDPARRGFGEATARYGLLMDHIEWAFVHGWAYLCPRPVTPLEGRREGLTREGWERLVEATPELRRRLDTSIGVFEDRRWREDARRWDERVKPRMRAGHERLQAVDPSTLDNAALGPHLEECRENLRLAILEHHRLNVAPVVPVGDFLAHALEWTGRPAGELLRLVTTGGPPSVGAGAELGRLVEAIRAERVVLPEASPGEDPEAVLASLVTRPDLVGRAAAAYLGLVGQWSTGSGADVGEPRLWELPHVLAATIRGAAAPTHEGRTGEADDLAADVRREVPRTERELFDALLAEARETHRVRDERAVYCDVWAFGLARRAILEAGRRLLDLGLLTDAAHLVEAGADEMRSLLATRSGPSDEDLAARARYRREAGEDEVPEVLGDEPPPPVPVGWLPPHAARLERAFREYVRAMSGEAEAAAGAAAARGLGASPGRVEGRARVVRTAMELGRIERGDVLVTGATTPAFNVVLTLVAALVTDRGGLLSHAAIVAREFRIPAVVGTQEATRRIPDGARVLVDGDAGEVRLLE